MNEQAQPQNNAEGELNIINAIRGFMDRDTRLMPAEINTYIACNDYLNKLTEVAKAAFIKAQQAPDPEAEEKPKPKRTKKT